MLPVPQLSTLHPVAVVQLGQGHLLAGLSLMTTAPCRHCLSSCTQTQRHNTQHTLLGLPRTLRMGPAGKQTCTCPGLISLGIGIGWTLPDAGESQAHCFPPASAVSLERPGAAPPHAGSAAETALTPGGWGTAAAPQDEHAHQL